jgi:hypothetical protein
LRLIEVNVTAKKASKIDLLSTNGGAEATLNPSISLARGAIYEQLKERWRSETQKPLKS